MNKIIIIELAFWFIWFYAFNLNVYVKKWLGLNTFKIFKPWDCFQCMNFWTAVTHQIIVNCITFSGLFEIFYVISIHYLIAALIQTLVEGPKI